MELVDVYNNKRDKLNLVRERKNIGKGEYRLSVHVWIMNDNKIGIQKRDSNKEIFPNLWEQSGGEVIAGETSKDAVIRECKEELNINILDSELIYIGSYLRIDDIVDIWLLNKNLDKENIILEKGEVSDIKFVTFDEFDKMIEDNKVVPTINPSYMLLRNYCETYKMQHEFIIKEN